MGELPPGQYWGRRFVLYTINGVPDIDASQYRFNMFGLVNRNIEVTLDELESMQRSVLHADFHCVTKWSIRDCEWSGVPFSALTEQSGMKEKAEYVFAYSLDGYTTVMPLENMKDAMLATRLNGERLPAEQGAPVRLVVPSLYGWKSAKWLSAIELIGEYRNGFWEERGYHERGDFLEEERFMDPAARFIHKKVAPARRI